MTAVGTLRAPTDGDLGLVACLTSMTSPDLVPESDVARTWAAPGFDRELDARVDGEAYVQLEELGDDRVWIDVRGRPSDAILDWAEVRAREKGTRLISGSWSTNEEILRALRQRGFAPVRHSLRLAIELASPTPVPEWPPGIEVRSFRPGDDRAFYDAQQEAFLDSWEPVGATFEEWSHWLLEAPWFDPELWFLALDGEEAAGFAICHARTGDPDTGSVRLLGVRRPWRRRGLGRALLLHAFAELRRRGFGRAGLGVDADSPTGAHELYEKAGMRVEARFDIYEKAAA
jgi:ribosomal protein S18 acetylase RimI-like enzyme